MYNRVNQILEQYPLTVNQTGKGRGAALCDTDQGLKILKEYSGSEARADFLYKQLSRYYKRNKCETGNFSAALIGHPKLVTDKYIENMKRLIQMIKSDTRFNLCNIYEVYKNKSLKRG